MGPVPSFASTFEPALELVRLGFKAFSVAWLAVFLAQSAIGAAPEEQAGVQGLLMPFEHARLASRSKGVIESIRREGEKVKAGETVMRLESDMEVLQAAQQEHVLALRSFEKEASDELSQKSVISKTEVEEKRVNHEVAKVQLAMAKRMLEMRNVTAPFDGVISERLRERGEAVDEFTPVVVLVSLDKLFLEVYLPAESLQKVKVGDPVQVVSDQVQDKTFSGTVAEVAPAVNPASGEFKVRVSVPNPAGELAAGTAARAIFNVGDN